MKKENPLLPWLTLIADGLAIVAGLVWLPQLIDKFDERLSVNVILIVFIYGLFCVAVYLVRKLEKQLAPEDGAFALPPFLTSILFMRVMGVLFGLTLALIILDQLGYFQSIFLVDDRVLGAGESSAFFVYGPGALLAVSLFYILVISGETRETVLVNTGRYLPMALIGLLGVNGMMLLLTAVFRAHLFLWTAPQTILVAVLAVLLLLILFGPPRIWYLTKRPSWIPVISFAIMLLFFAWQIIA
jgi:hypothetical protein